LFWLRDALPLISNTLRPAPALASTLDVTPTVIVASWIRRPLLRWIWRNSASTFLT
jgi:hypothetical protein